MDLFTIKNGRAFPSVHALLIEPFKSIHANDTSPDKGESIKIFTYVELLCSPKKSNPFYGRSTEERPSYVKKEVWGDDPPDDPSMIMEAVLKNKELLAIASPTYPLFEASMEAAEQLKKVLAKPDFNERTNSGAAVTKPKDITSALKEIPEAIKSLETLRGKVNSELEDDTKTRNQREIGPYER